MRTLWRLADDTLRWAQELWRKHLAHLWRMMHWVPPLFALVTLWLFSCNGQLREVYLALAEAHRWPQLLLGLASIGIISLTLFTSYIQLTGNRVLALYGSMSNVYLDRWLQRTRDVLALAWAATPFLGLLLGLWQVSGPLPRVMDFWLASALFTAVVLYLLWRFRAERRLTTLARSAALLALIAVFAGGLLLDPPRQLMVTHALGPLAMVGLQLAAILAMLAGLAALRRYLLQIVLGVLAILIAGSFLASAPTPGTTGPSPRAADGAPEVVQAFRTWLAEREREVGEFNGRFPVFIVAAQGGGIYAASATATFLAKLQEECPSFGRHVFAISGVSGGAVGAALYHAYADDRDARPLSKCRAIPPRDPPHELMEDIRVALTRDHLTPVLGPLVPELALSLVSDVARLLSLSDRLDAIPRLGNWRTHALEASLACAHIDPDEAWSADDGCFETRSRLRLRKNLSASWRAGKGPHALILTTTRAEAGSTVAFSPFGLKDMGAPSIEAFADQPYGRPADKDALAVAAVASARFPGVLPPYTLEQGSRKWNFVDGGYADDSGVAVAGAIYRALRDANVKDVDVRLIVLTSDTSDDAARTAVGTTTLVEFRVPLEAVLNVRAGIGPREVVRALNQFSDRASTGIDARVFLVQFRTPFLGWMISKTSNDAIVPIVASHDPCPGKDAKGPPEAAARDASKSTRDLARENGCQLSYIRQLLRGAE